MYGLWFKLDVEGGPLVKLARYANVLADKSWDDLFNEETVEKLGALIIKLNRQRIELQKMTCELVCPIGYSYPRGR